MRIIHTDTDDIENPLRGGQPVRTYEINSRLSKFHQITVYTATYKGSQKEVVRDGITYKRLGVTVPKWGLSSHLTYLNRLSRAIKQTPHDLIVEEFTPPFGFCNLQKLTQAPVISMVQWHFFADWEKRYKLPFESMMRKRGKQYSPRNLIVQSNKMGEYFKEFLPEANIYKVPCGIDQALIQEAFVPGEYALFLGRLDTQHKGLDDLLLAWRLLKEQGVCIPLWLVGAGQDENYLKQTVKRYGLEQLVLFKGRLEHQAKQEALKHCQFMVMPSRQETFGITALEAMAFAKPVVAYDIDHLNELLNPDWAALVSLGDVNGIAEQVALLWKTPALVEQKGTRALQAAKYYLWDRLAIQQEQIYKEVIDKTV